MTTSNLLVELFVEELPPKALKKLGEAFAGVLFEQLKAQGLTAADSTLTNFASPRRLAAHITAVSAQAADEPLKQRLMPVAVAIKDGQPTPALRKKLASVGRESLADSWPTAENGPDQLIVESDGKADSVFLVGMAKGSSLLVGLQNALDEAIAKLPIPTVMSYQLESGCALPGWSSVSFVRPAHGLVALHGSTVVPVQALGLESGNLTHGHRFEAAVDPVMLKDADSYAETLARDGAVIAGFAERKEAIRHQLTTRAPDGCFPLMDPNGAIDDALLDEVTALVERPNVLVCEFEPQFLDVPQECLILTMKANQKYFPLLDATGKLTNKFLVVSNIRPADASLVIGGNERVVRPRLADAKFFFDQDRKKTLASRVAGLGKVVYHNKLGTQGERVERVRAIARAIASQLKFSDAQQAQVDQAAQLAKTDLVTDMVGEFPELQGIMGGYYALNDGLGEVVAHAIEDHYKPRFAGDALPRNDVGLVVALADKLETLAGMFGIGNLPTGDKDPFALRRHALGVVRMLIERDLSAQFHELTRLAFNAFPGGVLQDHVVELDEFLIERLKGYLRDAGSSAAEVDAAIHAQKLGKWSTLPKRLAAVRAFAALPEAPALAAANKRVGNILKKAEGTVEPRIYEALLVEPAEKALADALKLIAPKADSAWAAGQYAENLQALAALKGPVDDFFDKVMVNSEDPALKANRLGLLATLHAAMNRVADLSRLAA